MYNLAMASLPSRTVQKILFLIPYASIGWTGCYAISSIGLVATEEKGVAPHFRAFCWGPCIMLMFLVLYGVGAMGNHYVKVYCLIANFLYLLVFVANGLFGILLSSREEGFWAFWQCCGGNDSVFHRQLTMFWLFQIGYIINSVANPSISEIIPNKLYLGNAMLLAAASPNLLLADEWNITHMCWSCCVG